MRLPDISMRREVRDLVKRALKEDLGKGDVTSDALVGGGEKAQAFVVSHGRYVLSGGAVAGRAFRACGRRLKVRRLVDDGREITPGMKVLQVAGKARGILAAERVALNFLQRMTGIATLTRDFVSKAAPHGVKVLDTRKTTPGLRALEKYAVLCGGGTNHRMGLHDRVLIKDNHLVLWGARGRRGLGEAVRAARRAHPRLTVEIEVRSEHELREALEGAPDWILLDNMTLPQIRRCVEICAGRCRLEVSGGVSLATVGEIAATGVDAVSVGALTHSARAADLSLEFSPLRA